MELNKQELIYALSAAGSTHHDYEVNYLEGVRDEQWAGFYAAFVLGRLGNFARPTALARWLQEAPSVENWSVDAADYVLNKMEG